VNTEIRALAKSAMAARNSGVSRALSQMPLLPRFAIRARAAKVSA
jgi:hypothetical protein